MAVSSLALAVMEAYLFTSLRANCVSRCRVASLSTTAVASGMHCRMWVFTRSTLVDPPRRSTKEISTCASRSCMMRRAALLETVRTISSPVSTPESSTTSFIKALATSGASANSGSTVAPPPCFAPSGTTRSCPRKSAGDPGGAHQSRGGKVGGAKSLKERASANQPPQTPLEGRQRSSNHTLFK
eukprot:5581015-Pyramimonas_sp.AAC.1